MMPEVSTNAKVSTIPYSGIRFNQLRTGLQRERNSVSPISMMHAAKKVPRHNSRGVKIFPRSSDGKYDTSSKAPNVVNVITAQGDD